MGAGKERVTALTLYPRLTIHPPHHPPSAPVGEGDEGEWLVEARNEGNWNRNPRQ